ncbi:hypothetical protein MesoLj131b_56650 [Mesorhizobium sp. 131-2-5]|nr:hypothetical protein MesoLj131b_56650 [Mesorhizobium sp. 131-2-5]
MKIETAGIGFHPVAATAKQDMKGQASFFGRKIPKRHLNRFVKGQGVSPLIAAARAVHTVDQGDRPVSLQARPNLMFENALDLLLIRKWIEERLDESQPHLATLGNELQCGDVDIVGPNLAVPDYPVAGELKSGYTKMRKAHHKGFLIGYDIQLIYQMVS